MFRITTEDMGLKLRMIGLLPRAMRHNLIRSLVRVDDSSLADVVCKVAEAKEELIGAARLLHDSYRARGLIEAHPSGVRVVPQQAMPETVTFVAKRGEHVIGTISLVVDGGMALPMEKIYGEEVSALRQQGRRLAEVGALCVQPEFRHSGVSFLLNKLMYRTASEALGVDDLLIAVHPDAEDVYEAALGFRAFGSVRRYPGLSRKALAVALRLDLRSVKEDWRAAWGHLGPTTSNPFHIYFEREDPQIRVPANRAFVWESWPRRLEGIAELFAKRPDALKGLPKGQFDDLRAMIAAKGVVTATFREGPARAATTRRPDLTRGDELSPWPAWLTTQDWVMANA